MKKIIYLFSLIALASCTPMYYVSKYDIALSAVESPKNAKEQYGEYITTYYNSEEGKAVDNSFSDSRIDILCAPTMSSIPIKITNKTAHTISVHWDRAAFVDIYGQAQPITHTHAHPRSVIPRQASITDAITPFDRDYLIPALNNTAGEMQANTNKYKGCLFFVTLPIEIEGTLNEYILTFRVGDQTNTSEDYNISVRRVDEGNDYR